MIQGINDKDFKKSWEHKDLIVDYQSYNLDKN